MSALKKWTNDWLEITPTTLTRRQKFFALFWSVLYYILFPIALWALYPSWLKGEFHVGQFVILALALYFGMYAQILLDFGAFPRWERAVRWLTLPLVLLGKMLSAVFLTMFDVFAAIFGLALIAFVLIGIFGLLLIGFRAVF